MTIAACFVSDEGVILAADSTTTLVNPAPGGASTSLRHLNYAQKVFEVGAAGFGSLGVCIWGNAVIGQYSHRRLIMEFADELADAPVDSVDAAAARFSALLWTRFNAEYASQIGVARSLAALPSRTPEQQKQLNALKQSLGGGYCLGVTWWKQRQPKAFCIMYDPTMNNAPAPAPLGYGNPQFWGVPLLIGRILKGIDAGLARQLVAHPKWTGTPEELNALIAQFTLSPPPHMPLREAVDFIHASIYTTIKGLKFSQMPALCGGPIEIALISADRPFRWIKHKRLSEALDHA